jgi:predicted homoserine dehydrogenase-like protein
MGEGPPYSFFTPYHLVHFEVPSAIARVVLTRDFWPSLGGLVVEVRAVAKRELKAGETLMITACMTYGEAVNADEMCRMKYLPEDCRRLRFEERYP